MAWEARSGLKRSTSPITNRLLYRLNGLGSPFGFETFSNRILISPEAGGLNGLGSPFGFETHGRGRVVKEQLLAKWPGKPVRV